MISSGTPGWSPGERGGRPRSPARLTSASAQRTDTAEIVSDGLTPSEVGMIEESMQYTPSYP
jgi:hypothetical protein